MYPVKQFLLSLGLLSWQDYQPCLVVVTFRYLFFDYSLTSTSLTPDPRSFLRHQIFVDRILLLKVPLSTIPTVLLSLIFVDGDISDRPVNTRSPFSVERESCFWFLIRILPNFNLRKKKSTNSFFLKLLSRTQNLLHSFLFPYFYMSWNIPDLTPSESTRPTDVQRNHRVTCSSLTLTPEVPTTTTTPTLTTPSLVTQRVKVRNRDYLYLVLTIDEKSWLEGSYHRE